MAPKPIDVEIRSQGVDGVRRDLKLVGEGATEAGEKSGRAARGIAGAFVEIAHSGEVGVRAMKEMAREGAEFATMFGTGGPILGAIALIGIAFFEAFDRGRKEMEKTRLAALQELQAIAEGGDLVAAGKAAQRLYSGDPYALMGGKKEGESDEAFYGRVFGVAGLQNTIGLNSAEIERLKAKSTPEGENQIIRLTQANERLNKVLGDQNALHAQAMVLVEQLAAKSGEITKNLLAHQRDNLGVDEVAVISNLSALESLFGISHEDAGHQKGVRGFGLLPKEAFQVDMSKLKIRAETIPPDLFNAATLRIEALWEQATQQMADTMATGIADTLGTVLGDAFSGTFDEIGGDALGGLGGILASIGGTLIQFGIAMETLNLALDNPFTSGIAAIGVGVLLEGLGKALEKTAHGHSGSGGGGGGFSATSAYGAQQSVAGSMGPLTVYVPRSGAVLDPNNKDSVDAWLDFIQQMQATRQVNIVVE